MRALADFLRRRPVGRRLVGGLLALLLTSVSCGREITAPNGALMVSAPLAFVTQFQPLPGQAGTLQGSIAFSRLRAVLVRLGGGTAVDRTLDFPSDADSIALSLTPSFGPNATAAGERMILLLQFITAAGDTVFRTGPDTVLIEPARSGQTPAPVAVTPRYVGPGAAATRVELTPSELSVLGNDGATFTAQAFDALGILVPDAPIFFTSADTTLVRFADPRSGAATTIARRDSTLVFATLLNGASDTARVRVSLPAAILSRITGDAQSGNIGSTLAAPVTVRVTASDAVPVAGVVVSFAVSEGSVGATAVQTDANGEASTAWTLGNTVGTQTLTASVAGLTGSPVTFTATALSGAPVSLQVTAQPNDAVAGTALGSITVTARDAQSNVATSFDGDVTIAIGANAGGGTLSGTQTVTAVNGLAVFDDLSIDRSGTGYTLVASAPGLATAATDGFDITPAAAAALVFLVQPTSAAVGTVLAPPVQVEAQDAFGNRATDFTGTVTLTLGANPSGAALDGTLAQPTVAGVATFADLTLDALGAGYTLVASATDLTDAVSAAFNTVVQVNAWASASSGLWSTGANWSLGRAPVASDSVVIAVPGSYTVTLDVNYSGSHLALGAATGTQTLAVSGRTLELHETLTTVAGGTIDAFNAQITGSGSMHSAGSLLFRQMSVSLPLTNAGLLVVNATVDFTAPLTATASSIIRVLPDGSTGFASLGILAGGTNAGLVELTASVSAYTAILAPAPAPLVNEATGTIHVLPGTGGTRSISGAITNAGSIIVDHPLTWNSFSVSQLNTGSIAVNANTNVAQSGTGPSFTNEGSITIAAGQTLGIGGGVFTDAANGVSGTGTLSFGGITAEFADDFVLGGLDVSASNTTFAGSGSLTVSSGRTFSVRSSVINVPFVVEGTFLVDGASSLALAPMTTAGALIRIAGSGATGFGTLTTPGFTNLGAIELTSTVSTYSALLSIASGTLVNAPGASLSVLVGTGGSRALQGAVDNQGSIVMQQPLAWSAANVASGNSGSIDVASASLTLNQSGSAAFTFGGTFNIAGGHALTITGGSITRDGGTFTGAGPLVLTNLTIAGPEAFVNPIGQSLLLRTVTATAPMQNEGLLDLDFVNAFQGGLTTTALSTMRLSAGGGSAQSVLTVNGGFSNFGLIELTSVTAAYTAALTVTGGTLVNEPTGTIRVLTGTGGPRGLAAAVENRGLIEVNAPLTWTGTSVSQLNEGSIVANADIGVTQGGTAPSFTNLGDITIAAARTFQVTGGAFTQTPSGMLGSGTLAFTNVAVEFTAPFVSSGLSLSLVGSAVTGTGSLTNSTGRSLYMRNSGIAIPLINEGTVTADGNANLSGGVTTASPASAIRLLPGGSTGFTNLSVVGFTNSGIIELTSSVSGYSSTLTVASGTLVNTVTGQIIVAPGTGGARNIVGSVDNQGNIGIFTQLNWTAANANITNGGLIEVSSGDLGISQSGTSQFLLTGTIDIASGRSMAISGGSFAQDGGMFVGAGPLSLSSVTVAGPGSFVNSAGRTVRMRFVTVNAPVENAGTIVVNSPSTFSDAVTTVSGSILRVEPDGASGNASLTVANGFTNEGSIELTATTSTYPSAFTISSGTLVNAAGGTISSLPGSGGTRTLSAAVENAGTITVQHPLTWNTNTSASVVGGQLLVSGGDLVVNQSAGAVLTVAGDVDIGSGRTMVVNNGALAQTTGSFVGAGPLQLTGVSVVGPGTFINPVGRSTVLRNASIAAPFTNAGLLDVRRPSSITGALTTTSTSAIRVGHDGVVSDVALNVANGFTNLGTIELTSDLTSYVSRLIVGSGTLVNAPGATMSVLPGAGGTRELNAQVDNQGTMVIQHPLTWTNGSFVSENNGLLDVAGGNLTLNQGSGGQFISDGNIAVAAGRTFTLRGGAFEQTGGGFLGSGVFDFQDGSIVGTLVEVPSGFSMRLRTATVQAQLDNSGTVWVSVSSTFNGALRNNVGALLRIASDGAQSTTTLTVDSSFTNAGVLELSSTVASYAAELNMLGSFLTNSGTGTISVLRATGGERRILAQVVNAGQLVMSPGDATQLLITGALTNTTSGAITMGISGLAAGTQFDQIAVSGSLVLGGTLNVTLDGGFVPAISDAFQLITSSALSAVFATANLAAPLSPNVLYAGNAVTVVR